MSSERVSIHFTGRPSCMAAAAATRYSTYTAAFGPKPPPTQGHTTRTAAGSSPRTAASAGCTECGAWCEIQQVMPPAGSPGTMRQPLDSIGTPARRWLTIATSATTSAPSSGSLVGTERGGEAHVAPAVGEEQRARRRASASAWETTDRQRVDLDHDRLGGVDRLGAGLGDDGGDDVADEADPVTRRTPAG